MNPDERPNDASYLDDEAPQIPAASASDSSHADVGLLEAAIQAADREKVRNSRRLANLGTWGAIGGGVLLAYRSPYDDPLHTAAGLTIYALALLPVLRWARRAQSWFPIFEIFMATGLAFYALPYLGGRSEIAAFNDATLLTTAWVLIAFQSSAYLTFVSTRGFETKSRFLLQEVVPKSVTKNSTLGLWANTTYICLTNFTDIVPWELRGILRAIFFGLGIVAVFICFRQWGQGELTQRTKIIVALNLLVQSVMQAATLYLITVIALNALAAIAYSAASRKIPWAVIVVLPMIAFLHEGKPQMRKVHWVDGQSTPAFSELPAFFSEWFDYSMNPPEETESQENMGTGLLHRASLFQMLALTVSQIPERLAFLEGSSYRDIPALFVPRIFWPNKPTSLAANDRLSIYFGLVREGSTGNVSIAFGTVAEAYANFGVLGVMGLGALMGFGFKRVCVAAAHATVFSPLGLFSVLLTAWSFQVEMVAATWCSSLFQATVAVVGMPMILKRIFP